MCPGERGFADNLGEESQVPVPAGTAVPLASASPSGMGREISGLCWVGICACFGLDMLEWAPWGQAHHSHMRWDNTALLRAASHCQTPKCCSGGWFADFLSCAGFSGVSHPGATCPCCARAAGWSLSGWHLRARYRAGVKSTMGKCLVDF